MLYGLKAMMKAAGAAKGYIGVELNKVDVIKVLQEKVQGDAGIEIVPLRVKYPQGEEKMLIYAITGRVVPAGGLPVDVGVVVNNVGTAAALADLLQTGKPLISRVITVTGKGINEPKNLEVPVGALLEDVFAYCGGLKERRPDYFGRADDWSGPLPVGSAGLERDLRDPDPGQGRGGREGVYGLYSLREVCGSLPVFPSPQLPRALWGKNRLEEAKGMGPWNAGSAVRARMFVPAGAR